MTNPSFNQDLLPRFKEIIPSQVEPAVRELLEKNRQKVKALLAQPTPYTWGNLMQPLEEMTDEKTKHGRRFPIYMP